MNVTTEVRQNSWSKHPTWSAFVLIDGDLTSWDCTHLHQSEARAIMCLGQLEDDAVRLLNGPHSAVELIDRERGIWQLTVNPAGCRSWMKRFTRYRAA